MTSMAVARLGVSFRWLIVGACVAGTLAGTAHAQLAINRFTVDGGGSTSAGGMFTLGGTIGQPDAGNHQSVAYQLNGGFWFGGGVIVAIDPTETPLAPPPFHLYAARPNPFNPLTQIAFDLPTTEHVRLNIYNMRGELVATLVDGDRPAGTHRLMWNGRDRRGMRAASGVYLFHLEAGEFAARQKITLVR